MMELGTKKRLMFVKGDDFYFLSYNILLLLKVLGCHDSSHKFRDYRKLAFLIDFVADYNLSNVIRMNENHIHLNTIDRELLMRTYSNGMIRMHQIIRLLFTLEKKQLIVLEREPESDIIDIYLKQESVPDSLFDKELFKAEMNNTIVLKTQVKRLSALTFETTLKKLFDNYGITRWAVY